MRRRYGRRWNPAGDDTPAQNRVLDAISLMGAMAMIERCVREEGPRLDQAL